MYVFPDLLNRTVRTRLPELGWQDLPYFPEHMSVQLIRLR